MISGPTRKRGKEALPCRREMTTEGGPESGGELPDGLAEVLAQQAYGAAYSGSGTPAPPAGALKRVTLAALHGIAPGDPIEGMLAAQLAASHHAAMECFRRAALRGQTLEGRRLNLGFADRLVRASSALAEALARTRSKGRQVVRVEHVTVNAGGQAIVGAVAHPRGRCAPESEDRAHAKQLAHASEPALPGKDEELQPLPLASRHG